MGVSTPLGSESVPLKMRFCVVFFVGLATLMDLNTALPTSTGTQEILKLKKRSIDFMGMRVSYPQYLRLVAIQKEVIRMDVTIRAMLRNYDPVELAQNPYWMELLELYEALKKMLPADYLDTIGDNPVTSLFESQE